VAWVMGSCWGAGGWMGSQGFGVQGLWERGGKRGLTHVPVFRMDCNEGVVLSSPYVMHGIKLIYLFRHHYRLVQGTVV
jgi:hypothetical protein